VPAAFRRFPRIALSPNRGALNRRARNNRRGRRAGNRTTRARRRRCWNSLGLFEIDAAKNDGSSGRLSWRGFFYRRLCDMNRRGRRWFWFGGRRRVRDMRRARRFKLNGSLRRCLRARLDEGRFLVGGFSFREKLCGEFFNGLLNDRRRLNYGRGRFFGRRLSFHPGRSFRLRHFHAARAAANDVGAYPTFDNGFTGLNLAEIFVFRGDDAIGHHLFFANMDLRFFLRSQRDADPCDLVVLKGALGFAPPQTQLIQLGDEVLGLNSQLLG